MASLVQKFTKSKNKVIQYEEANDTLSNTDMEEGKNEAFLPPEARFRNQNNFDSLNSSMMSNKLDSCLDETQTQFTEEDKEEQKEKYNFNINSEAWPKHEQIPIKSKVHKIIRTQLKSIDKTKIEYKQLKGYHIEEIRKLHNEWFPLEYQDEFFRRIYKKNCVAIGAFYPVEKETINKEGIIKEKKERHVILGCSLTKIERDNDDINEIYRQKQAGRGIGGFFNQLLCRQYQGAYIMTIGVVDECRREGVGTALLNFTQSIVQQMWPSCEIIYLHVVDYNETAVKFYLRNSFTKSRTLKDHYIIKGSNYGAIVMYKDLAPAYLQQRENAVPALQPWSYYDYLWFPYEYMKEYYERRNTEKQ